MLSIIIVHVNACVRDLLIVISIEPNESELMKVHVYVPQYPESTSVRCSSEALTDSEVTNACLFERSANSAVVDQLTGVIEPVSTHDIVAF